MGQVLAGPAAARVASSRHAPTSATARWERLMAGRWGSSAERSAQIAKGRDPSRTRRASARMITRSDGYTCIKNTQNCGVRGSAPRSEDHPTPTTSGLIAGRAAPRLAAGGAPEQAHQLPCKKRRWLEAQWAPLACVEGGGRRWAMSGTVSNRASRCAGAVKCCSVDDPIESRQEWWQAQRVRRKGSTGAEGASRGKGFRAVPTGPEAGIRGVCGDGALPGSDAAPGFRSLACNRASDHWLRASRRWVV